MINNNKGLTLFEILVAFVMFSVFYVVFIGSQSDNVLDSQYMEEELVLHNLCENVINDILFAPPPLNESLTLKPDTKAFEETEYSDYEYTVEYQQFEIPNFFNLQKSQDEDESDQNNQNAQYMKILYEQIKENVKQALWQLRVTVRNKVTDSRFTLSAWIRNPESKIQTQLGGSSGSSSNSNSNGSNNTSGGN